MALAAAVTNWKTQNTQDQERRDMDTDNTKRDAEPSPASAGSQPVAWAVGNPALSRTRAVSVHPQRKWAEASARHTGRSDGDILPLYLAPQEVITEDEMSAIAWAADTLCVGWSDLTPDDKDRSRKAADRLRYMVARVS
jgi:hypothetical protein